MLDQWTTFQNLVPTLPIMKLLVRPLEVIKQITFCGATEGFMVLFSHKQHYSKTCNNTLMVKVGGVTL